MTTKEEQMRAEFYKAFPKFAGILEMADAGAIEYLDSMTARHQFTVWQACAESYEKKLAEKDAEIAKWKRGFDVYEPAYKNIYDELSEANARNARLVEVLLKVEWSVHKYDPAHGHSYSCPICAGAKNRANLRHISQEVGHSAGCTLAEAISANSESVAAWEAEKLEPLRREVAAEQLHIKELREALLSVLVTFEIDIHDGFNETVVEALAKQPNTRALEKALLEAELKGLATPDFELSYTARELQAKLAELNKE